MTEVSGPGALRPAAQQRYGVEAEVRTPDRRDGAQYPKDDLQPRV